MPDVVDEAVENQKRNVELGTGRAFDSWVELARASGPEKHGELVAWLKSQHGIARGLRPSLIVAWAALLSHAPPPRHSLRPPPIPHSAPARYCQYRI